MSAGKCSRVIRRLTILPLDSKGVPEDVNKNVRRYQMYQLIVFLAAGNTTQAVPIMAEPPVKVVPLPNNTGTYVDLSNRIASTSAEWTILSYFDLLKEITAFKKNIEELSAWCSEADLVRQ